MQSRKVSEYPRFPLLDDRSNPSCREYVPYHYDILLSDCPHNNVQRQAVPSGICVSSTLVPSPPAVMRFVGLRLHQAPANVLQQQAIPALKTCCTSIDGGLLPQRQVLRPPRVRQVVVPSSDTLSSTARTHCKSLVPMLGSV